MMAPLLSINTFFSLMHGIYSPYELCLRAKELGYSTVAITDRNNLYGLPDFLKSCDKIGLRPIIGAEISSENGSVLLYSHGAVGYSHMCKVITDKHCKSDFEIVQSLCKNSEGLYAVSDSVELLKELENVLPVFYRIKDLKKPPSLIRDRGVPCLIIPQAAFITPDDFKIHKLLRAIDLNTSLSRVLPADLYPENSILQSWETVTEKFAVFCDALAETERFAETVLSYTDFGVPVMPELGMDDYAEQELREKCFEGAKQRYSFINQTVKDRLNYELDLICGKGFAGYFLVVDDIVKQSPRTCGRGSGAASCVAYCLGITNVDPIRYNLMFERFLNPGRVDPPDIDVDFAWDERDDVLEYVFRKYGREYTAMVANHLTFQPRMAMRETARVYGLTESEISTVTKRFPCFYEMGRQGINIGEMLTKHPRTKHLPLDDPWPEIITTARKLIGIPRGIGAHCGGVVITPYPIWQYVPVQPSPKGYQVIHWEKDGAEDMGLVKIDLLGNRSLAVIRDAIQNIKNNRISFDEKRWDPASDKKTIDMLASGGSIGVFYVESPATRLLQKKTGHGDFEHLIIHSSIIRPAANKYINEYIRRLHGGDYIPEHPLLSKVLAETYGIMVYQEDVARVAMALAGFSSSEADALRKIMSKKDRQFKLNDFREKFFRGAAKKGVDNQSIAKIWEMCLSFTGYSFCKPHSASYVQVSFQSAYLKAHYPAEMMAAVISNYGGFYTTQAYISECQRLGITILPPDVNHSVDKFKARDRQIRVGLCQIKGLSENARKIIVLERGANGPYSNLHNLLKRTEMEENDAEMLIYAGACDSLEPQANRSKLFWQMRSFYRTGRNTGTPELKQYPKRDLLRAEYKMLGFLTVCHPITLINYRKKYRNVIKINAIERFVDKVVSFYGWCVTAKTVMTKFGDPMQFVSFEDETGMCETVLFPDAYAKFIRYLMNQEVFYLSGKVMQEFGAVTVEIRRVEPV